MASSTQPQSDLNISGTILAIYHIVFVCDTLPIHGVKYGYFIETWGRNRVNMRLRILGIKLFETDTNKSIIPGIGLFRSFSNTDGVKYRRELYCSISGIAESRYHYIIVIVGNVSRLHCIIS